MGQVWGKPWQWVFVLSLICLSPLSRGANSNPVTNKEILDFAELLKNFQLYPEFIQLLEPEEKGLVERFKKYDTLTLKSLPPDAFRNLYQRFFTQFVGIRETREKLQSQIQVLKEKKIGLPLGDKKGIVEIDLKIKASEDQVKQAKFVSFSTSFAANKALMEMLTSPSVKSISQTSSEPPSGGLATKNEASPGPRKDLPGVPQGSKSDRKNTAEADKLNLTPVDPEFYNTQLGKKLERDLGGRAEYWNYDFDQDELYVVVGSEAGKIRVKQRDQATRIIQTRVGDDFQDFPSNYQGDETINLNIAKGRFLTGDLSEPTLFGPFPVAPGPASVPEGLDPKHKKGDGHNH